MRRLLTPLLCATVASVFIACADNMMSATSKAAGKMLIDAGEVLMDAARSPGVSPVETSIAHAQCDASCNAQPIELAGPIKVITAETDAAQLIGGYSPLHSDNAQWDELAEGPLVVTDLLLLNGSNSQLAVADAGKCANGKLLASSYNVLNITGVHLLVPKGKVLCIAGGEARWAGFRPYE